MEPVDTFDDGPYTDGPMEGSSEIHTDEVETQEAIDDGWGEEAEEGQSAEEAPKQAEKEEEIDKDSQVSLLDEEEAPRKEEEEESSDKGDEESKSKDEESESADKSESKDDVPENDGDSAEEVRTLKAFRDGKQYEIPEDAQIKVKVAGKSEKVPLSELRDSYSGKVRYDEKFADLGEKEKTFNQDREVYEQEIGLIRDHLSNVAGLVKESLAGKASPSAGMEYLLDLMGGNALQYKKAMYENMADEFDLYAQMTETERDAYWAKQENSYLKTKQESFEKNQSQEQAQAELTAKVTNLREAHGISEDAYISAEQDLKASGEENLTPERIVTAARLKPLLETSEELIEPYLDQLTDDEASAVAVDIATTMFNTPELTVDQIKQILAEEYKVEKLVTDLEKKVQTKQVENKAKTPARSDELDMFD